MGFWENGEDLGVGERRSRTLPVAEAVAAAESYEAYVLEEGAADAGGTQWQVAVHPGVGVGNNKRSGWGRSGQEHMNCRVTKPREMQSIFESYSCFFFPFTCNLLHTPTHSHSVSVKTVTIN